MRPLYCIFICLLAIVLAPSVAFGEKGKDAGEAAAQPHEKPSQGYGNFAESDFFIGAGVQISNTPYKGYKLQWTPLPIIGYEGDYFYIRGLNAGVKILNKKYVEVSAFVGYDSSSYYSSESEDTNMRKLHDRFPSMVVGGEVRVLTPYGMPYLNVSGDVLGHSSGITADLGYKNSLEYKDFEFVPSLGVRFESSDYSSYYYGVSGDESRRSGLDKYEPGASFSPHVGLNIDYTITDKWDVFLGGEVLFLGSMIKDSPMVNKSATYELTTGVNYTF